MAREELETMMDLSSPDNRRKLMVTIGRLTGMYQVSLKPRRITRTNAQNSYVWGVVYESVRAGIREAWGEDLSADEVHLMMRARFLERPVVNRETGEVQQVIAGSTAALSVSEFAEYIDKIVQFAAEFLNVTVPPADPMYAGRVV